MRLAPVHSRTVEAERDAGARPTSHDRYDLKHLRRAIDYDPYPLPPRGSSRRARRSAVAPTVNRRELTKQRPSESRIPPFSATRPWRRERLFLPLSGHCPMRRRGVGWVDFGPLGPARLMHVARSLPGQKCKIFAHLFGALSEPSLWRSVWYLFWAQSRDEAGRGSDVSGSLFCAHKPCLRLVVGADGCSDPG